MSSSGKEGNHRQGSMGKKKTLARQGKKLWLSYGRRSGHEETARMVLTFPARGGKTLGNLCGERRPPRAFCGGTLRGVSEGKWWMRVAWELGGGEENLPPD